jgi:aspartyl-tRNA(Asn)/glutamyl-tRNA(Gln) amidotransferase subunit A
VGFKATYGLLDPKGILEGEKADELIIKLGHPAFMSRTVEDAALLLNVLSESEKSQSKFKSDYSKALETTETPRLGIVKNFQATDEIRTAFSNAVETFRSLGCATSELEVPFEKASFDVRNIERDRKTISETLFKDIDVLLLPTIAELTPTLAEAENREKSKAQNEPAFSPSNTFFCNYFGLPAITVPCGFDGNNMPLGLQVVGPHWSEGRVLDAANRYQQATKWHFQRPPVSK